VTGGGHRIGDPSPYLVRNGPLCRSIPTTSPGFTASMPERCDDAAIGWIYGIAHHQLSAFYRRGGVERRAMDRLGVERRALTDPEYERIEELAGLAETRGRVAAALGELPAEHADVLRLRVVDELG
jgi:DNA-directed RNA polymerase specialized sigma24 family protein